MDTIKNTKFHELDYDEFEEINLEMLKKLDSKTETEMESEYASFLKKEKAIKAVTICFSNIEGRFHMLEVILS